MTSETRLYLKRLFAQLLADSFKRPGPRFTPRRLFRSVSIPGKVSVIVGMRRVGKTTFLHQQRQQLLDSGVSIERLPYINFEDERLGGVQAEDLSLLVEEYYRLFPQFRSRETVTWFFDEMQVVPGWERFVRRLLDTEKVDIFVTGSSAKLLSREIATSLRGREWEVLLFPFSFEEFLRHRGGQLPGRPDLLSSAERSHLEHEFRLFLQIGGFPEAQRIGDGDRWTLLRQYVDVAVYRDVIERHQLTNVVALRWLVRHLLGNPAGLFSAHKFYRDLKSQGMAVGISTVHQMLAALEDCFLIRVSWLHAASERQRMVNPRKVFPVDMGLIPVYDRSGKANVGHALETAVRIELERRGAEVFYAKTQEGYEVDFLGVFPNGERQLIQVCADLAETSTLEREIRALQSALTENRGAKAILVTLGPECVSVAPEGVEVKSAVEWFLSP